jgi:hypothetical protein
MAVFQERRPFHPVQNALSTSSKRTGNRPVSSALDGKHRDNLPYGLDVLIEGIGKVLNIEWDENGSVGTRSI